MTVYLSRRYAVKRLVLMFLFVSFPLLSAEPTPRHESNQTTVSTNGAASDDEVTKRTNPKESIQKLQHKSREEGTKTMQKYWKNTFKDIKNLGVDYPKTSTSKKRGGSTMLNQWKLFLDDGYSPSARWNVTQSGEKTRRLSRPRFEGFVDWERQLQQWADDISDYIEKTQAEQGEYRFSTYGKSPPAVLASNKTLTTNEENRTIASSSRKARTSKGEVVPPVVSIVLPQENATAQKLPVPAPAKPGEAVLPHTDISDKSKRILIVTTASLPWMTGTAVNPLLRAAYLCTGRKKAGGSVTLMLPWVERESDQHKVYGKDKEFKNQEDQEDYIRTWLRDTANMKEASEALEIRWYPSWLEPAENSLYSMGDITALIPADEVDICILEEPEHLNWYRAPGESWTSKFKHVVGIIHTNYFAYAQEQPAAFIRAPGMKLLASWMCRAHSHRLIKLSGTLGQFAPEKELVENVHGVRGRFLEVGEELKQKLLSPEGASDPVFGPEAEPSVYFIGKMLWSKGIGSLMELLKYAEESADLRIKVDMYGGGPDKDAADTRSTKLGLEMPFHGPIDHAELAMTHKIFINPSTSEVLCTTVAEALAMGKFVVLPSHPSNDFFAQFPNCLPYASKEEFVGNLYYALTHSPEPLSEEYSFALTWEAATQRLEAAGAIPVAEAELMEEALSSADAGVEFKLPPLIEDGERRKQIADTFRKSRERYRQFRSRLHQEIQRTKVLPPDLQNKVLADLDKRLDIDIDSILESPTLRLQLSPAELDKRLLNFYTKVTDGAGGDVIRMAGGGSVVGRQTLYMKQQAQKHRRQEAQPLDPPAWAQMDKPEADDTRVTQLVKRALRQNLPSRSGNFVPGAKSALNTQAKNQDKTQMSICYSCRPTFTRGPPRLTKTSLLI